MSNKDIIQGLPLRGESVSTAMQILRLFRANSSLMSYSVVQVDVTNLSKIYFTLSENFDVIVDTDRLAQKIRILGIVLSQKTFEVKNVQYVDLRFKEPIIGKK